MTDSSAATDWRFFRWMRGMDAPRRAGWIGGVCAGIADRIRIDPIIVRGIAVVLAVLGAPALLLYAAAWLLLPDTEDRIHLERLLRGRFDPAIVGAGVMLLLQLTPLTAGFWFLGYSYWSEPYGGVGWFFRVLWTGFMLVAVVLFILWMARRARASEQRAAYDASSQSAGTAGTAPFAGAAPFAGTAGADAGAPSGAWVASPTGTVSGGAQGPDAQGASSAQSASPATAAGGAAPTPGAPAGPTGPSSEYAPQPGEPVAPTPPPADAPADQFAAWRQQHESWKLHHTAWAAQQRGGVDARIRRELAAQRAAEREARHTEWREQQRRRRAANPRVGFLPTVLALGAALLGAGAVVLGLRDAGIGEVSLVAAFATAAAVFGIAMIVAGAARRRSGFLAFLAAASLVVASLGALVPTDREFIPWTVASLDLNDDAAVTQPLGDLYINWSGSWGPDGTFDESGELHANGAEPASAIDVQKRFGTIWINVPEGVVVEIDLEADGGTRGYVEESTWEGDWGSYSIQATDGRLQATIGDGDSIDAVITGSLGDATVQIQHSVSVLTEDLDGGSTDSSPTDPTQTEEVQP